MRSSGLWSVRARSRRGARAPGGSGRTRTPARPRRGSAPGSCCCSSCTRAAGTSPSSTHDRAAHAGRLRHGAAAGPAPAAAGRACRPGPPAGSGASAPSTARAGPPQRAHQHQRRQVAEVARGAGHALVERPVHVALPRPVAGVRHGDGAVGDLPAVQALAAASPGRSPRRRVKNAHGIEPSSTSSRNATPGTDRRRLDAQPDRGEERVRRRADQLDRRAGADRPLDADRRRLAEGRPRCRTRSASVACDDLLLHLAVQRDATSRCRTSSWRRSISGSCSASWVSAACSAPRSARSHRHDHRLQGRRRELAAGRAPRRRHADRVADPDVGRAPTACRSGRPARSAAGGRAAVEDADRGHLRRPSPAPKRTRSRTRSVPANMPRRTRSSRPPAPRSTLKTVPDDRAVGVAVGRRQQLGDAVDQLVDPGAGDGRAEQHRVHQRPPGLPASARRSRRYGTVPRPST